MECSEFEKKAVLHDTRNRFTKFDGNLDCVPDVLKTFYKESNPLDVEINSVRFLPVEKLDSLQAEYAFLNAQLIMHMFRKSQYNFMWRVVYNKGWNIVRVCCLAQTQSPSHYKWIFCHI